MPTPINTAWTPEERQRLRQKRKDLRYSLPEIAARLGVAHETLQAAETGRFRASHDLHQRWASLLESLDPKPITRPTWLGRKAFRARRIALGFSLEYAAALFGRNRNSFAWWESGRLVPTVDEQEQLARLLLRLESEQPPVLPASWKNQHGRDIAAAPRKAAGKPAKAPPQYCNCGHVARITVSGVVMEPVTSAICSVCQSVMATYVATVTGRADALTAAATAG